MSELSGDVSVVECDTFFTTTQKPFPKLTADGKIETKPFLEAAEGVVALVEFYGPVFFCVRDDMMGNIQLKKVYDEDPSKYFYLDDMILSEKAQGGRIASDSLLWLRRGLELFRVFYTYLIEETRAGTVTDDVRPLLRKAYQETLAAYHGWVTKQLFKLVCQMLPCRKDLMLGLALGQDDIESTVIRHMSSFVVDLKCNTQAVYKLYKDNDIELDTMA
ncbi:glycolipid transfer protein isoform X2 [Hetaerina americana]|uniref:glycolipid transfer protein isoform X2 n=1 Tax=Hetaerina americana TaxID=62018 RepID=UPI003A7F46B8